MERPIIPVDAYGTCAPCHLPATGPTAFTFKPCSHLKTSCTLQVRPPRSSGCSHERKLKSYAAEGVFYNSVAPQLLQHTHCTVPQPFHIDIQPAASFTFVLSDLSHDFPQQQHSYNLEEAQVGSRAAKVAAASAARLPPVQEAASARVSVASQLHS